MTLTNVGQKQNIFKNLQYKGFVFNNLVKQLTSYYGLKMKLLHKNFMVLLTKRLTRIIQVQSTAIARHKAKIRGRSTFGPRVKDCALRSQLIVDGDYYGLPPQKVKSNKLVHSLTKAINENCGNARKH